MREPQSQLEYLFDDLMSSGNLEITTPVLWRQRDGYLTARLPIPHTTYAIFLDLKKNTRLPRYSFQLVVNGYPARRFCSDQPHTNPRDCADLPTLKARGYHKHRWTDLTGDECVYIPEDMTAASIEVAFDEFCEECGITFGGLWYDPPPS